MPKNKTSFALTLLEVRTSLIKIVRTVTPQLIWHL